MTHTLEEVKQQYIIDNAVDIWNTDDDLSTVRISDEIYTLLNNIIVNKLNAIQYGNNNVYITTNNYVMVVNIKDETFRFAKILTKLFIVESNGNLNVTKNRTRNSSAIVLNKDDFNITFNFHQLLQFLNEVKKVEKLCNNSVRLLAGLFKVYVGWKFLAESNLFNWHGVIAVCKNTR